MISNQILRSSWTLSRFLIRFDSTSPKKSSSSSQNQSTNKTRDGKSNSEYLAADMYNYTTFSYYDLETSMAKFRLPQPSAYSSLKPSESAPQKK